jgi:hypothetical protein
MFPSSYRRNALDQGGLQIMVSHTISRLRKILLTGGATFGLIAGSLVTAAPAAQAYSSDNCHLDGALLCGWTDSYAGGDTVRVFMNNSFTGWASLDFSGKFNDSISSLMNNTQNSSIWFEDAKMSGSTVTFGVNVYYSNLLAKILRLGTTWNDRISSVEYYNSRM